MNSSRRYIFSLLFRRSVGRGNRALLLAVGICILGIGLAADGSPSEGEKLYSLAGHRWFEDVIAAAAISSSGDWALVGSSGHEHLISLSRKEEETARLKSGLTSVHRTFLCGEGFLLRHGKRNEEEGWFLGSSENGMERVDFLMDGIPVCTRGGKRVAVFRAGVQGGGLSIGDWKERSEVMLQGVVTGAAFSPDGGFVYALARQADGSSTLWRVEVGAGRAEILARDLDACPLASPLSVSPDGSRVYLSLAGKRVPDAAKRQKPEAGRWLNLYQFDCAKRRLKQVLASDVDKIAPVEAHGYLYWAQTTCNSSIVALPAAGGVGYEVAAAAEVPSWRPDARQVGFGFGEWRTVDWALDWDAGVVNVDVQARPTSGRKVIIAGNHEDFPPQWSPDGRWIAFHSHRASKPVAYYDAPGSADDIWLRRADDPRGIEIRLTDFCWEVGSPSWSPDGRRLLFCSLDRRGHSGNYVLWATTIEPETGRVVRHEKVPLPPEIHSPIWAIWSPKGDAIAVEDVIGSGQQAICILNTEGKQVRRLVTYRSDTYSGLDWTPDAKLIVYSALQEGRMQVFAIPESGGSPRKLSEETANLLHPCVSPDGRWIACTRFLSVQEVWRRKL